MAGPPARRAAEEKAAGDFLGWFRFHPNRRGPPGEIVLGFRLRRSAWEQGYAIKPVHWATSA
jgi:hypothetical protein